MRISTAGLLVLAAASMLVGCVSERTVFHSPDGMNFVREGYRGEPAPAIPPANPPRTEPMSSR